MSQNYDDIQAQLAAYIDGDLPPEQRAEIEKYLAANPSHQALLGELATHKRVLGSLPRVKAPADLTEELLTLLEREQLLAEPALGQDRSFILRLFSGPGLAVAASVALMIGLVVAVYHVLPGRPPVASVTPSSDDAGVKPAQSLAKNLTSAGEDRKTGLAPDTAMSPAVLAKGTADKATWVQELHEVEAPALRPSAQNAEKVILTVAAPDVDQANGQVLRFLADNDIEWSVGADAEVQNFRSRSYPRVVSLTEPARIQEYSRAIAEELKSTGQADASSLAGVGGGRGGGGGVAGRAPVVSPAPRPTPDGGGQMALAPSAPRKEANSFGGMIVRRMSKDDLPAETLQQEGLASASTTEQNGQFKGYTNTLAQANSRTILARGLKASQVEQLAMVFDGPGQVQAGPAGRELHPGPTASTLRGSLPRDAAAPRGLAAGEQQTADPLARVDHEKEAMALDGVETKQELAERLLVRPMAKPAAGMVDAPATQPVAGPSPVVIADQDAGLFDRYKYKKQTDPAEKRAVLQLDSAAVLVPPATRPADQELYDVLIVLSSPPVAPPAFNEPAPAAASPIPAAAPVTAPASRPVPDAKRE